MQANVDAVRDVCARARPDVALANHLVMGPAILARGLGGAVPYAVKVHGSALEYVVKRDPERFLPWAREGLARARGRSSSARATRASRCGRRCRTTALPERTRLGPPGVDVDEFRPRDDAAAGVAALIERLDGQRGRRRRGRLRARRRRRRRAPCASSTSPATATSASSASSSSPRGSTCCWRRGRSCPRPGSWSSASAPSATACSRCSTRWPTATATPCAGHRAGRARARGRPASAAAPSAGLPRDRRRRLLGRGPRPARARRPHRAPGARRARAAAGRLRGAGLPQHVPRGLRDGGRRGGGVRRAAGLCRALGREGGQRDAGGRRARSRRAAGCRSRSTTTRCGRSPRACAHGCRRRTMCGPPRGPRSWPPRASASRGRAWPPGSSRRRRDGWRSCRPWPEIECRADGSRALQTRPASRIRGPCGGGRRARAERLLGAAQGRRRQPRLGQAAVRAEVRLVPRARARRHQGHHGAEPRRGLPAGDQGRDAALGLRRRDPRPDPASQPQRRHAGQARHGRPGLRRSPPTSRSRSPPAARTPACWPPRSSRPAAASPPSRRTATSRSTPTRPASSRS